MTTFNKVDQALSFPLANDFERDLTVMLAQQDAGAQPLIVVLLDIDNFHAINTSFGHAEGDRVLIEMGSYLKGLLPDGATLYHISGDSFGMLFQNDMEKEDVFLFMEDLRRSLSLTLPDGAPVTLTAGVAAAFEDGARYHELVRKADGALYRGKLSGRNKICLAKEEKMVTKTSHYTVEQLQKLTKLSKSANTGEAILLREALDDLLKKYDN